MTFGLPNPAQESCFTLSICPDLILAAAALAGAAAFIVLYLAITANPNGKRRRRKRRRKRGAEGSPTTSSDQYLDELRRRLPPSLALGNSPFEDGTK